MTQAVTHFTPQRCRRFDLRTVCVGYVVDKVVLEWTFLFPFHQCFILIVHYLPLMLH